jgi:hypothetical protein
VRLSWSWAVISSSVIESMRPARTLPALLISTSIPPKAAVACATTSAGTPGWERSAVTTAAWLPAARTCSATSSRGMSSRERGASEQTGGPDRCADALGLEARLWSAERAACCLAVAAGCARGPLLHGGGGHVNRSRRRGQRPRRRRHLNSSPTRCTASTSACAPPPPSSGSLAPPGVPVVPGEPLRVPVSRCSRPCLRPRSRSARRSRCCFGRYAALRARSATTSSGSSQLRV